MDKTKKHKSLSKKQVDGSLRSKNKKTFFKRKRHDFNIGSSSEGQGFTISRKLKAMKKYASTTKSKSVKNVDNEDSTASSQKEFERTKFNKFEDVQKKYQDMIAADKIKKKQNEKEREVHKKTVNINIKQRRKLKKDLSKKTKKGQLVMANQMKHLLEKIQSTT